MKRIGLLLAGLLLIAGMAQAAQVRLAWDAPTNNTDGTPLTDLAGYKLFWGTNSAVYYGMTNVGNVTTGRVDGLTEGRTYYFSGKAYNVGLDESDYCTEIMWVCPDVTPPVFISGVVARTVRVPKLGTTPLPDFRAGVVMSDNVSPAASIVLTQSPAIGTVLGVGTYLVTLTARDQAGNSAVTTANFTVFVRYSLPMTNLRVVP